MEAFHYEALDAAGRTVTGVVQADTPRQARAQLRAQGLLPSEIGKVHTRDRARQLWARGISSAELSLVTRQLAKDSQYDLRARTRRMITSRI